MNSGGGAWMTGRIEGLPGGVTGAAPAEPGARTDFAETLRSVIEQVSELQQHADRRRKGQSGLPDDGRGTKQNHSGVPGNRPDAVLADRHRPAGSTGER